MSRLMGTLLLLLSTAGLPQALAEEPPRSLELSRPVRPWEFLSAVGTRAGLFGNETGRFEAWVYPLKILRDFHLRFHVEGRVLPAEALARTVIVRPEASTIVFSGDTFRVRETLFVPAREPGAIIFFEVETEQPVEIEAVFQRDFQLEWPASLGGTYLRWMPALRAFSFEEEQKRFAALVGSPTADMVLQEYQTNYYESPDNSIRLGVTRKGSEAKIIVIAASMDGAAEAARVYRRLSSDSNGLLRESAEFYRAYLGQTVNLELPDAQLQRAYDWSRISVVQGIVKNPYLGTGLVAGYRRSGESQRPGFAWFFGRDALWTSLALDAAGDSANTKTALEFLSKYQREDGKIPHEISQSASLVPWFKNYVYAYASADATPLFIIAMNDYVVQSGDVAFAKEKWDSLSKAYQFLRSTYDAQGLPQNFAIGHGWVEGGPLLPVKTELYYSALGAEALRALSNLARLAGREDTSEKLTQEFTEQRLKVNQVFWSLEKRIFAFALDRENRRVEEPSVLATVPMWFGLLDDERAQQMITELADSAHQTDWGMRIISSRSPKYSAGGYHFGSVWPLFTGWASVGEYRYHRALPAYSNLRANALLALDGSLGHVTEVLSGTYYEPLSTSSPHQIWSAAMVVSPLLRGLFGLGADSTNQTLTFAPHVPAGWTTFSVGNLHLTGVTLNLRYHKRAEEITLDVTRTGSGDCTLEFRPALSLRAEVRRVEWNGRPVAYRIETSSVDQHVVVRVEVKESQGTLRIRLRNDFGLSYSSSLPPLGGTSGGLRILSESWTPSRDQLVLEVSGVADGQYELAVWNPGQIASLEGAELVNMDGGETKVRIRFPASESGLNPHSKIVFHFSGKTGSSKRGKPQPPN